MSWLTTVSYAEGEIILVCHSIHEADVECVTGLFLIPPWPLCIQYQQSIPLQGELLEGTTWV